MAVKYECSSCGATMTLASVVSSVKCPVCRLDMLPVEERNAAIPRMGKNAAPGSSHRSKTVPPAVAPSATGQAIPAGIKIAKPVTERAKHAAAGTSGAVPVATASQKGPSADAAAQKLMTDARTEADRIVGEAETQKQEILEHAEAHAREQVEEFFEKARKEAAESEVKARQEAARIISSAEQKAADIIREASERSEEEARGTLADEKRELDRLKKELEQRLASAASPRQDMGDASESGQPEAEIDAATKAAVDKALVEERERAAKRDLESKKSEVNTYAKREARLLFAGGAFSVVVLLHCVTILTSGVTGGARAFTFVMVAVDLLLFIGLVAVILQHYRAGKAVVKRQRDAREKRQEQRGVGVAEAQPSASPNRANVRGGIPAETGESGPAAKALKPGPRETEGRAAVSKGKSTANSVKSVRIKAGAGTAKRAPSDALKKAAKKAAAKRAGVKSK